MSKPWWACKLNEMTPQGKKALSYLLRYHTDRTEELEVQVRRFLALGSLDPKTKRKVEEITQPIGANRTICFDLDGTLANCEGGWEKHSAEPGTPFPSVYHKLRQLKELGFTIGIHSTRDFDTVERWLRKWKLEHLVDWINKNPDNPLGTSDKPFWTYYVGDRAYRAAGNRELSRVVSKIIKGEREE